MYERPKPMILIDEATSIMDAEIEFVVYGRI